MSSKCLTFNVVINELLAFIRNTVDFMEEEHIIKLCASKFTPDEIIKAKHLLEESMPDAKKILKGNNDNSRDLFNIVWLIKNGDREKLPIFAAVDLERIPVCYEDGTAIKYPINQTVSTKQFEDARNMRISFGDQPSSLSSKKTLQNLSGKKQTTPETFLLLPPEILAIIFQQLDTKSVYNFYNSSAHFQKLFRLQGVVTKCTFSVNSLATVKSLNSTFFHDISDSLKVLNLSGVSDLNLSLLLKALQNLERLQDLDVSYTNIVMPNFLEIVKVRPRLKSIAINFTFGNEDSSGIRGSLSSTYQQAFEGLVKVHFVSEPDNFDAGLAVYMLPNSGLLNFKLTFSCDIFFNWCYFFFNKNQTLPNFSQLQLHFGRGFRIPVILKFPIFRLMDFSKYEIVMFGFEDCRTNRTKIIATSLLHKIIEYFTADVECLSDGPPSFSGLEAKLMLLYRTCITRKIVIIFYNREHTNFDKEFNSNLLTIVKEYFVFNVDCSALTQVPQKYKWYRIDQIYNINNELNYDIPFKEKEDIKLIITFVHRVPPLKQNFAYLKQLSHLILSEGRFNKTIFFEKLFKFCVSLVTLQVMSDDLESAEIFNNLSESKSLKNIYVDGFIGEFNSVFDGLSKCRTLENIYLIADKTDDVEEIPNPKRLFIRCHNLYNLHIRLCMAHDLLEECRTFYKILQSDLGRTGLNIDIHNMFVYNKNQRAKKKKHECDYNFFLPYLNPFHPF